MQMLFQKIRNVKNLTRATKGSAGIDFYIPEHSESFIKDLINKNLKMQNRISDTCILLKCGEKIAIPSGYKFKGVENHALILFSKSGLSSKKGIDVLSCVIDEDYQGEIHISIINNSDDIQFIKYGEKIIQAILIPIVYGEIQIKEENIFKEETERGEKGFGSSDIEKTKEGNNIC